MYSADHYGTLDMQFLSFLMLLSLIECLVKKFPNFQISWKNLLNRHLVTITNTYLGTLTDFSRK